MLFYSYPFILLYLPIVLAGFFLLAKISHRFGAGWLAAASLFFYGYWNPRFLTLILASIAFNYVIGYWIAGRSRRGMARPLLIFAIAANLAVLGYFKYTNFFISSADALYHDHWALMDITLPLGISIFTFTQIAFICDVYRGIATEYSFIHYVLFVTYFPHLVAGPVIHHRQIMPCFDDAETYRMRVENIATGALTFTIGLAKKVLLAASFAEYADPVFDGAKVLQPGLFVAWLGALAYTLQIYFDFSGYSDMAIGLSRLFGIPLPENFNSPYKARNIIEFWRRWNITLSHFLRDYLYIPLGGSRRSDLQRYMNLITTMLLGGLWHGANWTFVAWGGLHGLYLVINHLWIGLKTRLGIAKQCSCDYSASTAVTFLMVVVAWVFFRADSFKVAARMLQGMIAYGDAAQWRHFFFGNADVTFDYWLPPDANGYRFAMLGIGLGLVWIAPNTHTLASNVRLIGAPLKFATIGASIFWISLLAAISASREIPQFIYFNF